MLVCKILNAVELVETILLCKCENLPYSKSKFTFRSQQPDIVPIICHRCATGGKFAAGIVDIGGKFATGINNTSETGGKTAAGINDSGASFAASVVDTSGKFATWCR